MKLSEVINSISTNRAGETLDFLKGKVMQCAIGNSILYDPNISSALRNPGNESYLCNSIIAKVVCALLDPKSVGWESIKASALTSTGTVIAEIIDGDGEKTYFSIDDAGPNGVQEREIRVSTGSKIATEFLWLIGIFIRDLSVDLEVKFLWSLALNLKKPVTVYTLKEKYSVASICDHYEYTSMKDVEFVESSSPLLASEIKRASDSGSLVPLKIEGIEPIVEAKKDAKKEKKLTPEKVLENAKKGMYKIDYSFDYDVIGYIPDTSVLDTYVPTEVYSRLLQTMYATMKNAAEDCARGLPRLPLLNNYALFGEPSGGKTALLRALAASLHVPYFTVTGNQYTEDDTVEGKVKSINGNIQCEPTPFLLAFKNGGIVALEEINLWNTNVSMGVLGQALEGPQTIMEDGYMPVKRHALCFAVATFNPATKGSNELNEALQTRFRVTEEVVRPSKSQLVQIICNGHKDSKKPAEYIYMVYDKLLKWLKSDDSGAFDVASVVTLRGCQAALELYLIPGKPYTMREAIISGLFNQAIMKNEDLRNDLYSQLSGIPEYTE